MIYKLIFICVLFFNKTVLGCNSWQLSLIDKKNLIETYKKITLFEKPSVSTSPYFQDIKSAFVQISFDISEEGKAININILCSEPKKIFDRTIIRAVKKLKFLPKRKDDPGEYILMYCYDSKNGFSLCSEY